MKRWLSKSFWIVVAIAVVLLIVRAFAPTRVIVDTSTITRSSLRVTVQDDGRTRVRERYTISAPIQGRLLRTSLRPGDPVEAGRTTVAVFAPIAPDLLDARSREQAQKSVQRSDAALESAAARRRQAEADLVLAKQSLERARGLRDQGLEADKKRESAEHEERRAREGLRAAEFAEQVARYERDIARASLREPDSTEIDRTEAAVDGSEERPDRDGRLRLRSPINGTVLRVFEESARTLAPGAAILEVGNTRGLEIVGDFLSQDAVRVRPGMRVMIDGWSGEREQVLEGRVRVVEPGGFTKTSALGVEEQRVNIVVDPTGDAAVWAQFGDGYHVDLDVVLWEREDLTIVPVGALFRRDGDWMTFVVDAGVARARRVTIGESNGLRARVLDGLSVGDRVILYPNDLVHDGAPVEAR